MMPRYLCTLLLCFLFFSVAAQDEDSLFVIAQNKSWVMPYVTGQKETVFMVARRFHVPPAVLGSMNNMDQKGTFPTHTSIIIPIAAYNFIREKPNEMIDALPLYHMVKEDDDLLHIAKLSGVSQQVMERWNSLPDNNIYIDHSLFVGWVLYDATSGGKHIQTTIEDPYANNATQANNNKFRQNDEPRPKPNPESQWPGMQRKDPPPQPAKAQRVDDWAEEAASGSKQWRDTVIVIRKGNDTVKTSPFEELYASQTNNEVNVATEKGSVAFFNSGSKSPQVYYAFHNDMPRGIIIKVHNPGTDKTVYAKVIGPLPATRQYYNCIMALSGNAKEELGVKGDKAWFEISHR